MDAEALVAYVQAELSAAADPEDAAPMAAYMKTDMPFYGVKKPGRVPIFRAIKRQHAPTSIEEYEAGVRALWQLEHREEKYLAIEYACGFRKHITSASLELYRQMVQEGAWWDLVDPVATNLVGRVLLEEREATREIVEAWIDDEDMWLRRTAILAHNRHKDQTDEAQLFDFCVRRAHEKEFFIGKAIGWALRSYSKTRPEAVGAFLDEHREILSGLSYREGAKWMIRQGIREE